VAFVGAEGPKTASIAIIGEKPGRTELQLNRPFVGASGNELNELLLKNGISRSAVYITNAVKEVNSLDNPTKSEIKAEMISLYRELSSLPNLAVCVPMGQAALSSLSAFQLDSITSYRGSVLSTVFGKKMVPTFHPAYYMRGEWRMKPIVKFDIARALEESYDPQIHVPTREYRIIERREDLLTCLTDLTGAEYLSFDIELHRGRFIECIAFSSNPSVAYCVPITNGRRQPYWKNTRDEVLAWRVIYSLLNQEKTTYVTQNGLFDCWHLWRHGIQTPYMARGYDTMLMHRLRAPDLPHDLGFLVSIYTREPYYKDESGDWKVQNRSVTDEQFYIYNCKDAACTLEVCYELIKDLQKYQLLEYYREEIQAQWDVITHMRQTGMRVSTNALFEAREKISSEIQRREKDITSYLGWTPNTKSPIDTEKMYKQLGVKYDLTSGGKSGRPRPKMDAERVYTYAANTPRHRDFLFGIADLNEQRTLRSGFLGIALDERQFYHPSLSISKTVTGRLASTGADEGGPQIQNIPKSLRNLFIPDNPETDEFTQADLKGAEAMALAWYTQDPLLLKGFQQNKDIHRIRGCIIYRDYRGVDLPLDSLMDTIKLVCDKCAAHGEKDCPHSERHLSKVNGHAFPYLQGVRRAARELRKVGVFIQESELERIKNKIVSAHISQWHKDTEMALRRSPWLTLPFFDGESSTRKREFYGLLDQEMLRAALSWQCQALVGRITNRAMIRLHHKFGEAKWPDDKPPRIVTQTHDSLLVTHNKNSRGYVVAALHEVFNQTVIIKGNPLTIPIDITHGPNWRDLK